MPTGWQIAWSVAISPDGQLVAAGIRDAIIVWRLSDGVRVRTFSGHNGFVFGVAFSPDGRTLASAGSDNTVKLWSVPFGALLRTLTGHTNYVETVAFSPDGRTLSSGGWDQTVRMWRVSDGTLLRTLTGHFDHVRSVQFSARGDLLASGSWDNTIKVWRVLDGSLVRTLSAPGVSSVNSVAFLSDGQRLASGSYDGHPRIWRLSDGAVLGTFGHHTAPVGGVDFSPDGQLFASGGDNTTIKLWRVTDGTVLRTLQGHLDLINAVSFSPDSQIIASGVGSPPPDTLDPSIRLWRVSDGTQLRMLPGHAGGTFTVDYSPDGQTLASGGADNRAKIWRASDGALLHTLTGHSHWVAAVAYSPDGQMLASGGGVAIRLWRVSDGTLIRTLPGNAYAVSSLAFSPDGQTLAATADGYGDNLQLWRVSDGALLRTINADPNGFVQSVAFSPDGTTVLSASGYTFRIRQWRVSDGAMLASYSRETGSGMFPELPIAFSPDGSAVWLRPDRCDGRHGAQRLRCRNRASFRPSVRAVVTVLRSSGEWLGFEGAVEQAISNFRMVAVRASLRRFAGGAQASIKLRQDGIVTRGDQGCHIEACAHGSTARQRWSVCPARIPLSRLKGANPASAAASRRLSYSQFWHLRAKSRAAVRGPTPATAVSFCALTDELLGLGNELSNEPINLIDLFLHLLAQAFTQSHQSALGQLGAVILLRHQQATQIPTLTFQFAQFILLGLGGLCRWRLDRFAEATEQVRVNRVSLGQDTTGSSVLAHSTCLDQADFDPSALQHLEQSALVASAGFTDYLHRASDLAQALHERISSRRVVGHAPGLLSPRHVQIRFGDINSDIDFLLLHVVRNSCL